MQSKQKVFTLVLLLTIIGVIVHFFNLNWGAPYYFHPDERNIASAVTQLRFPFQMNPHFFAYGSLPIYTIYFTGLLSNLLTKLPTAHVSFEQAILISRFYSALFATLLIPLLFVIGKKVKNQTVGLVAAFLATTSVGLTQFAHFGTFEMWLTFFTTLLFFLSLLYLRSNRTLTAFTLGLITGVLVSIKISHLVLLPLPLAVIILSNLRKKSRKRHLLRLVSHSLFFIASAALVYVLTNPYIFWDTHAFLASMHYESSVVLGTLPVFYTGEFFGTTPVLFQFLSSYPFLLNPLITILFIPSFVYLIVKTIKTRNPYFFLLTTFCLLLFLSQAFLFAKWTRYLVPTLPFIYLIVAIGIIDFLKLFYSSSETTAESRSISSRLARTITFQLTIISITVCFLFSLSYLITAFVEPDTRVAAKEFEQKNIPPDAQILSETYDLGITPFNDSFHKITLINPYELDNHNPDEGQRLTSELVNSSYLILPSQRVIKVRLRNPDKFPSGNLFYHNLVTGKLGYQKIYETPCDIFCQITYVGDPIFRFEETVNVFDRPTVMIFKKL